MNNSLLPLKTNMSDNGKKNACFFSNGFFPTRRWNRGEQGWTGTHLLRSYLRYNPYRVIDLVWDLIRNYTTLCSKWNYNGVFWRYLKGTLGIVKFIPHACIPKDAIVTSRRLAFMFKVTEICYDFVLRICAWNLSELFVSAYMLLTTKNTYAQVKLLTSSPKNSG